MPAVTLCSPSQKLGFKGSRYEQTRCALGEPCQQRRYKAACMFLAFAFWHRSPAPESCRAGAPGAGEEARKPGACLEHRASLPYSGTVSITQLPAISARNGQNHIPC